MNRKYEPTSRRARATFATAAVLVSLLIGSGIDGLVDHYQGTTQVASNAPVVVAQR
jgi:hypothetical protein